MDEIDRECDRRGLSGWERVRFREGVEWFSGLVIPKLPPIPKRIHKRNRPGEYVNLQGERKRHEYD